MGDGTVVDGSPEGQSALVVDRARLHARRIDHVGVVVRNISEAEISFESEFGARRSVRWRDPAQRFLLSYLEVGDSTLQLIEPLLPGPLMTFLRAHGEGLHHVCLEVDSIEDVALRSPSLIEAPYTGGRGLPVCFLRETRHGVTIELTSNA